MYFYFLISIVISKIRYSCLQEVLASMAAQTSREVFLLARAQDMHQNKNHKHLLV